MRTPDIFGQTPIMHHLAVFTQKQACMARQFPEAEDLINLVSLPCRAANVVRHHDIMQPYLKPNWSIWPADLPQQQIPQVELTTAFHSRSGSVQPAPLFGLHPQELRVSPATFFPH